MPYGKILLGGLTSIMLTFRADYGHAQDVEKQPPTQAAAPGQETGAGETLKERLSDKASDEQRVDNCKVPLDRRGPKIRPDDCNHDDAGAERAQTPR